MKKTITLLAFLVAFISQAQQIPNAGFENWNTNTNWFDPIPMSTSNYFCFFGNNSASVSRSEESHGGTYAALLSTQNSGLLGAPTSGMIAMGVAIGFTPVNPIPFSGYPDSLVFWAKSNIASGDMAQLSFNLYSLGQPVSSLNYQITSSTDTYVRISLPFEYFSLDTPDAMDFFISNSNQNNPNFATTLLVDDISLIYNTESGDAFPGGDFENWNQTSVEEPDMWYSSNMLTLPSISTTKDNNAHSGEFCARIENQFSELIGDNFGLMFLGDFYGDNCDAQSIVLPAGTYPHTYSGYYKYVVEDPMDSASVYILCRYFDEKVMSCDSLFETVIYLPPAAEWTAFNYTFPEQVVQDWMNGTAPEYFTAGFAPSEIPLDQNGSLSGTLGNILWLDDLAIDYTYAIGVNEKVNSAFRLYPNPTRDHLTIQLTDNQALHAVQIFDLSGQLIMDVNINNFSGTIDTSTLSDGTYLVKSITSGNSYVQSFVVQK